jgi:hypothetical protein
LFLLPTADTTLKTFSVALYVVASALCETIMFDLIELQQNYDYGYTYISESALTLLMLCKRTNLAKCIIMLMFNGRERKISDALLVRVLTYISPLECYMWLSAKTTFQETQKTVFRLILGT